LCATPEDAVQEALLKLIQQPKVPENLPAWLYRVVRNEAIAQSRSANRRRRRESVVAEPEQWFMNVDDRIDGQAAAVALAELPEEIREVVVARVWGGLTLSEISDLCGVSVSTVHRRYDQGIAVLRETLGVTLE
jgi:RNA polymerase sigma-70 factor (ECF subfamily)